MEIKTLGLAQKRKHNIYVFRPKCNHLEPLQGIEINKAVFTFDSEYSNYV